MHPFPQSHHLPWQDGPGGDSGTSGYPQHPCPGAPQAASPSAGLSPAQDAASWLPRCVWPPLGTAGTGDPRGQGRTTAGVQTAPPAGRSIEEPSLIKTGHLVKGHPWVTATQPVSGSWTVPGAHRVPGAAELRGGRDPIPHLLQAAAGEEALLPKVISLQVIPPGTHHPAALASFQLFAYYF